MKKLLLSLVIAATLVSCNGSGKPHPTGDAEKDAKAYMEYAIKSAEAIQSEKDMAKFEKEMLGLRQEFDTYMEKNPEYKTAFLAQGDAEEADWDKFEKIATEKVKNFGSAEMKSELNVGHDDAELEDQ